MKTNVGEVTIPTEKDFDYFSSLATETDGWSKRYSSRSKQLPVKVFTKVVEGNDVRAAKVEALFNGVSALNVYESLQDPEFRKTWDDSMKEGSRICYVAPNSEIGYYRLKSPFGLKDRDFVNQRSWYADRSAYIIMNHSVAHKKKPPIEGVQRAISYITGYLIKPRDQNSCDFIYISHSDPRGKIPSWLVNTVVKTCAPMLTKRLYDAALRYESWKAGHDHDLKPWANFQQLQEYPPLDPADVVVFNASTVSKIGDDEEVPDNSLLPLTSADSMQSLNNDRTSSPVEGFNLM